MPIEIHMPRLSDTMEEGKMLKWLKQIGDQIEVGDIIAEIETDKADMEMEALDAGVLAEIQVQEGESVPVGGVIALLSEDGAEVKSTKQKKTAPHQDATSATEPPAEADEEQEPSSQSTQTAESATEEEETSTAPVKEERSARSSQPKTGRKVREMHEPEVREIGEVQEVQEAQPERSPQAGERILASPVVKRMAEEQGVDLRQIKGSGPSGRIIKQDFEAYLRQAPQPSPTQTLDRRQTEKPGTRPATPQAGEKKEFSRMRATIAKRMTDSMREVPHFYVTGEIDMSEAVRLRAALKTSDRVSTDVTYTHFLIKAIAIALERHPRLNASFAEGGRELKTNINIGLAVALDDGLIVPVLHDCDKLSLLEIAAQANALVERARTGKPRSEDLSGGTFTISNMGMLPVEHFTAIINQPQGAILAVGAIKERAVARDGQVRVAHTMMVTLSCDHRILDGTTGGQFIAELKQLLENPVGLMV